VNRVNGKLRLASPERRLTLVQSEIDLFINLERLPFYGMQFIKKYDEGPNTAKKKKKKF